MKYLVLVLIILKSILLYGQDKDTTCNRKVSFGMQKYLPNDFCMPEGFYVMDIYNHDSLYANNDKIKDLMISYSRQKIICKDTNFISLYYGQKDGSFKYVKTFTNLTVPKARYNDSEWLNNNCDDDYIHRYAFDNIGWINCYNHYIVVGFSTNFFEGYDFYFEFDDKANNWFLSLTQQWYMYETAYRNSIGGLIRMFEKKYDKNERKKVENGICIDDFRIDDYLEP